MKKRLMAVCMILGVLSIPLSASAEDLLASKSGTVFGKYGTTAKLTWTQSTGSMSAKTTCTGSGAEKSTALLVTFTKGGVIVEGPVSKSGTSSATISRPGCGFISPVSDHIVRYGDSTWKTRLTY